mgnify:CR=1 FL=1
MPRRGEVQARPIEPDPIYNSPLVTQVINKVMTAGKKSTAEQIVYGALERIGEKTGKPPVEVLEQAVKTVTPVLEVKSRRVGGANYQVPVEVPQRRARTLAVRWLVDFARGRREKGMIDKLSERGPGRPQPAGRGFQAQGRRLPHGAGQQGLRPLQVVAAMAIDTKSGIALDRVRNIGIMAHIDAGKTDDDRADPLLHRPHPQDGRGPRGRGDDGLDGAGAGARHHDHVCGDDGVVARLSHQHYRYARPRGLYGRGGAKPARPRRRDRRLRRGRRRPAPVRDGLAPGRALRRSAHRLHEQDGPHRRGLLRLDPVHGRPARRRIRCRSSCPSARRSTTAASSTSSRCARSPGPTTSARRWRLGEIPAELAEQAQEYHHQLIDSIAEFDDELTETYLMDEESVTPEMIRRALRRGRSRTRSRPCCSAPPSRTRACSRCSTRVIDYLPSPLDVPPVHGRRPAHARTSSRAAPALDEPFSALAFKVMSDPYVGKLTYFRVYSAS